VNTGTNGHVALGAPAGRLDRPGLSLGTDASGLFAPSGTEVAAAAAGVEVLRLSSAGAVTLGGAGGGAGFAVSTPANAVNRLAVAATAASGVPSLAAQGNDTNITMAVAAKGTGAIRMQTRGQTALEVNATGTPANHLRVDGVTSGGLPRLSAQGSDANISVQIAPKGTGLVDATGPLRLPTYTVASLPSASTFARCLIYVSDGSSNRRFAVSDGTAWRWPDGAVVS
jgi:hypothetical protein